MKRAGPVASALALALVTGCGADDPGRGSVARALDEIIATCSATSGDVQVKRNREGFWGRITVGSVFRPGDWVQSRADGYVRVELLGSGAFELDENAQVILDVQEAPDGGAASERSGLVAIESGEVRGVMESRDGGAARPLLFATADGQRGQLAATEGAGPVEFRLTRRQTKTEVSVSQGEATLDFSGDRKMLSPGTAAETDVGKLNSLVLLRAPSWGQPRPDARLMLAPGRTVLLRWESIAGAGRYRIQVAKDSSFRSAGVNREVDGAEYAFNPRDAATYHWRVAARDSDGRLGAYSTSRRIQLDPPPAAEHLLEPAPDAVLGQVGNSPIQVEFRWSPEAGVDEYRLVIARTADLDRDRRSFPSKAERQEVSTLKPGNYFWGVYAVQGEETKALFAQARPFSIKKMAASTLKAPKKVQQWGE